MRYKNGVTALIFRGRAGFAPAHRYMAAPAASDTCRRALFCVCHRCFGTASCKRAQCNAHLARQRVSANASMLCMRRCGAVRRAHCCSFSMCSCSAACMASSDVCAVPPPSSAMRSLRCRSDCMTPTTSKVTSATRVGILCSVFSRTCSTQAARSAAQARRCHCSLRKSLPPEPDNNSAEQRPRLSAKTL